MASFGGAVFRDSLALDSDVMASAVGGTQVRRCAALAGAGLLWCHMTSERRWDSPHLVIFYNKQSTPPTTQLIQIWYELRATAAAAGCCSSSAKVTAPILISDSPAALAARATAPALVAPPVAPSGWRPVEYGRAGFALARDGLVRPAPVEELLRTAAAATNNLATAASAGYKPSGGTVAPPPGGIGAFYKPTGAAALAPGGEGAAATTATPGYPAIGVGAPAAAMSPVQTYPPVGPQQPQAVPAPAVMEVPGPHTVPQQAPGW